MPRIERTVDAEQDLIDIWTRIADDKPGAADRFLDEVDEHLARLATNPMIGEARPDLGRNVRCLPVGNYVVFYRSIRNGILVLRVIHGSRDIPSVFRSRIR